MRSKIDEQCSDSTMLYRLRSIFEDKFRYDSKGIPRVWKPEDDVESIYSDARQTVEL